MEAYYVIHTRGEIVHAKTGKHLAIGDKIMSDDKVIFRSPSGKAVLMSVKRGRFIISGEQSKAKNKGELMTYVDTVLVPADDNIRLSSL